MTIFYIVTENEPIKIGEISYNTFYPDHGFEMIGNIIDDDNTELLEKLIIKDNSGNVYDLMKFFNIVSNYKLKIS